MTSSLPLNRFYAGSVATRGPKSWKTFETISSARQSPPPALCCTVRRHMPVGRMGPFTFRRYQTLGEAPSAPNRSMYPDRTSLQRSNANIPECHRPVIGLQEQGTAADFGQPPGMAGRCPQLQVFLHNLPVEDNLLEPGVGFLLSGLIEPWGLEDQVKCLPLTGRPRRVHLGGVTVIEVMVPRQQLRPRVDSPAIAAGQFLGSVAIDDLDLVQTLELHPRIRVAGNQELEMGLDVAEFLLREQVPGPAARPVDDHTTAGNGREPRRVLRVRSRIAGRQPGPRGFSPRRQLMIADQGDPARAVLERRSRAGEQGKPEENAPEAVQTWARAHGPVPGCSWVLIEMASAAQREITTRP